MTDVEDLAARRFAAFRACTRTLSGHRTPTMADQLATLNSLDIDLDRAPDIYGDGVVEELEAKVAALLGKPAAAYFPTGTMAQQVALRIWCEQAANLTVAVHPLHHLEEYERKAFSTLSGLRGVWATAEPRQPLAADIAALPEEFAVMVVELPMRRAGHVLPTLEELHQVCQAARARGARVHFDGARLWESVPYLGGDLPAVAELADSVYVSFYKMIGALSGAALAGPADFIGAAKTWRHRYGGQLCVQWPAVATAWAGLDGELPRLPSYVAHARLVAEALATLPGAVVYPNPPHTNAFQLWLPHPAEDLAGAALEMAEQEKVRFIIGWAPQPPGDRSVAEVIVAAQALEWTADDVVKVGADFIERVRARAA
jgi:threonine aldolase